MTCLLSKAAFLTLYGEQEEPMFFFRRWNEGLTLTPCYEFLVAESLGRFCLIRMEKYSKSGRVLILSPGPADENRHARWNPSGRHQQWRSRFICCSSCAFVNTDMKAGPYYLDRSDSHPAVMCATEAHYKHTDSRIACARPLPTSASPHTNTQSLSKTVFPVRSPSPLFPSSAQGFA